MRAPRLTTGSRARAALCSSEVDTIFHWIALRRTTGSRVSAAMVSAVRSICSAAFWDRAITDNRMPSGDFVMPVLAITEGCSGLVLSEHAPSARTHASNAGRAGVRCSRAGALRAVMAWSVREGCSETASPANSLRTPFLPQVRGTYFAAAVGGKSLNIFAMAL